MPDILQPEETEKYSIEEEEEEEFCVSQRAEKTFDSVIKNTQTWKAMVFFR